jgi:DNA-directed RNA polymerase specialized sigma24 family protein
MPQSSFTHSPELEDSTEEAIIEYKEVSVQTAAEFYNFFSADPSQPSTRRRVDWGTLLHLIREADPNAAESLYRLYASGLRMILRRQSGTTEVEDSIYIVLLQGARAVRDGKIDTLEALTTHMRDLASVQVSQLRLQRTSEASPPVPPDRAKRLSETWNTLLTRLSLAERDVLLRAYLLEQSDRQISGETGMPPSVVRRTRSKAKALFRRLHPDH